jgi:hypothetical protein
MEVKTSYLVKLENGTQAWLSVDKEIPVGATILEERPVLIPSEGMVLHKEGTDEYSYSTWLRDSTVAEWEEITQAEYDEIMKALNNTDGEI